MLWTIIVILLILWLLGFLGGIGGSLIHLLLVIALIVLVYNLVTGRKAGQADLPIHLHPRGGPVSDRPFLCPVSVRPGGSGRASPAT